MSYKNYLSKVLNEGTLRQKIDNILKGIDTDIRFHMPESRRKIISEILGELDGMKKKNILKLRDKILEKMDAGDTKIGKILEELDGISSEVLEVLFAQSKKLYRMIEDGRTGDPAIENFIQGLITDVAGFSDEELRTTVALENKIANALK